MIAFIVSRLFYSAFLNRTDYTDPSFTPTVMYSGSKYIIINEICKFSLQIIITKINNKSFSNHCLQYPFELLTLSYEHNEETLPPDRASNDAASGGRTYWIYN